MKILITGASGFIGTNLLEYFITKGYDVFNIDKGKPKDKSQIKYWYDVDICDLEKLKIAIDKIKPDYIVHLAAQADLNENDGLEYYSANILGVENIVKVVSDCKNIQRVIFTSSMLVNEVGYKAKDIFDYNPKTLYGQSKVMGEKIVFDNAPKLNEFCIIRPTSIWGEYFKEPYKNFFDYVLVGKFFHPGDKACNKTYGYIGNVVYQIEKLLFAKKEDIQGEVFNIGDKPAINISEWANEIADEAKISKPKKIPYFIFIFAGLFGDILGKVGIKFPMTSFRLNNMTTNHILDLDNTYGVCGDVPYNRIDGIKRTLAWMDIK
ncbi:NAD(P)-dependent oxidoreductase [bacterium]|jgi:GlcNAc-P-P-Und epimerase|nr:NAD(P)-dependent oxidoreductase [bacterium]